MGVRLMLVARMSALLRLALRMRRMVLIVIVFHPLIRSARRGGVSQQGRQGIERRLGGCRVCRIACREGFG